MDGFKIYELGCADRVANIVYDKKTNFKFALKYKLRLGSYIPNAFWGIAHVFPHRPTGISRQLAFLFAPVSEWSRDVSELEQVVLWSETLQINLVSQMPRFHL